jgi:hypothetical protein
MGGKMHIIMVVYARKGRSSLPTPVREKAVGASLSGVGGEGRPGAACLNAQ